MAKTESHSSDISSLTESEVVHPPEGEDGNMVNKKGLDSEDEGEISENPTALPSGPTTRQRPGRLEAQSDEETGRMSLTRAPRKALLKKLILPKTMEQGKALFRDTAVEPMDSSVLTDGVHTIPRSEGQDATVADISNITGAPNRDWDVPAVNASSGGTDIGIEAHLTKSVSGNVSRRSSNTSHFMELPPNAVIGERSMTYTDTEGLVHIRTDKTVQPLAPTSPLNTMGG